MRSVAILPRIHSLGFVVGYLSADSFDTTRGHPLLIMAEKFGAHKSRTTLHPNFIVAYRYLYYLFVDASASRAAL